MAKRVLWNGFRTIIKGLYTAGEGKKLYGLYKEGVYTDLSEPETLRKYLKSEEKEKEEKKCRPKTILSPKGRCIKIGGAAYKKYAKEGYFDQKKEVPKKVAPKKEVPKKKKVVPKKVVPKKELKMASLANASVDTILGIADALAVRDILALCAVDKEFDQKICNETFWRKFVNKKYKITKLSGYKSWSEETLPKSKTWKELAKTEDRLKELERRMNIFIELYKNFYVHTSPSRKYFIKKGRKYWSIWEPHGLTPVYRIDSNTGYIYSRTSNKKLANIFTDPHLGASIFLFKKERVSEMETYEPYPIYIPKEKPIKESYTLKDLEGLSKSELVAIYRGIGLKNEGAKNMGQLKKDIISRKVEKQEAEPKIDFKKGQDIVARYLGGRNRRVFFGKVIGFTKAGNPRLQEYEQEKVMLVNTPGETTYQVKPGKLTNYKITARYSPGQGYIIYPEGKGLSYHIFSDYIYDPKHKYIDEHLSD